MINDKITLIAELCCNHQGNYKLAEKMIDSLHSAEKNLRVDVIKFQKRTPKLILSDSEYNTPHPDENNSFGKTYGLHKENLEFNISQHKTLKNYCEEKGFSYCCSVFDINSTKEILSLQPKMIKISSANNNDYDLLKYIDQNYSGEIHISLGMTTQEEEEKIISQINNNRKNIVLYACTSAYPTPDDKTCLLEISRLKNKYANDIKGIGFSGHHLGIVQDIAAVTLGANYIERHFTLDKNLKGTDQKISLDINEFKALAQNLDTISKSLIYKPSEILDVEEDVRRRLKYKGFVCQ